MNTLSGRNRRVLSAALVAGALGSPGLVAAQEEVMAYDQRAALDSLASEYPTDSAAASVPFGPGEHMIYRVEVGWFDVGEGHVSVEALDTVRGNNTNRAVMEFGGSLLGLKVHDVSTSFFDIETLQSWRFLKVSDQVSYHGTRHYEMYPGEGRWVRPDKEIESPDHTGDLGSSFPLDDLSFIYFLRQMDLEVGRSYSIPRYFKDDGNPVVINVLRRELKKVDGGEFNTIVVQPIVQTDGLFGEGGEAEIYLTDDDRKIMVYMKSNIPRFPGALELYLKDYQPGVPLHPDAREVAAEGRASRAQVDPATNR